MASGEGGGPSQDIVSQRALQSIAKLDFLGDYALTANANPYDSEKNTEGIINMGTSVNRLMEDELEKRLQQSDGLKYSSEFQHYYPLFGTPQLRTAVADFLSRNLCQQRSISPENIIILSGVASCLDALGHAICDPGDVLITPTPVYARIFSNFCERALVDVQPLVTSREQTDAEGRPFTFTSEDLENRIQELTAEGKRVKGIVLVHPHNPLGRFYSESFLMEILKVCARHKMHIVVDEIYAFSIFEDEDQFVSTLALHPKPDPERMHFVWGLTKDLGLASFRVGVIHTLNENVIRCLKKISTFQCTPWIIQHTATTILNDKEWCDNFFLPTNRKKLRDACSQVRRRLQEMGLEVTGGKSGLFLWVNARPFMKDDSKEAEIELFEAIFKKRVFIIPGSQLYCVNPGWFRIIFSVNQKNLEVGLQKIKSVLDERRK